MSQISLKYAKLSILNKFVFQPFLTIHPYFIFISHSIISAATMITSHSESENANVFKTHMQQPTKMYPSEYPWVSEGKNKHRNMYVQLFERQRDRETHGERELPPLTSFSRCLRQWRPGQRQSQEPETQSGSLKGGVDRLKYQLSPAASRYAH